MTSRSAEHQFCLCRVNPDRIARPVLPAQDLLRQRILEPGLERALEQPGAVDRVETGLAEQIQRRVGDFEAHVAPEQTYSEVP